MYDTSDMSNKFTRLIYVYVRKRLQKMERILCNGKWRKL